MKYYNNNEHKQQTTETKYEAHGASEKEKKEQGTNEAK